MWDFILEYWALCVGSILLVGMFYVSWQQRREQRRWFSRTHPCPACRGIGRVRGAEGEASDE